jgi:hypothetical protein
MTNLCLKLRTDGDDVALQVAIRDLVIAGWTGRNQAAVDAHIKELLDLGVTPPRETPMFYRLSATLLTTANHIQVLGSGSTGEAEAVLINAGGQLLVGLGSDQTDRKAEATGVALSKQMCPKPLAADVWKFTSVEPHWDQLILRSFLVEAGEPRLYQEGSVAALRHPQDLMARYGGAAGLLPGLAMFCGTLPVIGGLRWADKFIIELQDPVLKRTIKHTYALEALTEWP